MQGMHNGYLKTLSEPTLNPHATWPTGATDRHRGVQGGSEAPCVLTGVRPWQHTPHHALADSRLEFAVRGRTLIVWCKTLTSAHHVKEDVARTVFLWVFVIVVNWLVMLPSSSATSQMYQGFPATLILVVYLIFALARGLVWTFLKPRLTISPEGWSVSYCSFGREDLLSGGQTHEYEALSGNLSSSDVKRCTDEAGDDLRLRLGDVRGLEAVPKAGCAAHGCATSSHSMSAEAGGVQAVGGMHAVHVLGTALQGGSEGALPASCGATNCAVCLLYTSDAADE